MERALGYRSSANSAGAAVADRDGFEHGRNASDDSRELLGSTVQPGVHARTQERPFVSERDLFEQPAHEPRFTRFVGVRGDGRTARTREGWPVVEQRRLQPVVGPATHEQVRLGRLPTVGSRRFGVDRDREHLREFGLIVVYRLSVLVRALGRRRIPQRESATVGPCDSFGHIDRERRIRAAISGEDDVLRAAVSEIIHEQHITGSVSNDPVDRVAKQL